MNSNEDTIQEMQHSSIVCTNLEFSWYIRNSLSLISLQQLPNQMNSFHLIHSLIHSNWIDLYENYFHRDSNEYVFKRGVCVKTCWMSVCGASLCSFSLPYSFLHTIFYAHALRSVLFWSLTWKMTWKQFSIHAMHQ